MKVSNKGERKGEGKGGGRGGAREGRVRRRRIGNSSKMQGEGERLKRDKGDKNE